MVRNIVTAAMAAVLVLGQCVRADLTPDQARRIDQAIPKQARVKPLKPRKVLIWDTPFMDKSPHKGYTIPQARYAFQTMGKVTGAYEAVVSDDVAMYLPKNLKQFDAILLNNANGPWIRPTADDMERFKDYGSDIDAVEKLLRKSLLDWLNNGGGIFAYHHAMAGNPQWPEFKELIGAGYWGHPWNEEIGVKLDEPDNPLLASFKGKNFRIADEIFQFREPYSRDKVRVLLSMDTANTNMTVPWVYRTDGDFALAWVKSVGKGRIFYGEFGHRTEIWWDSRILRFYLDAMQFVTGDLQAPTKPLGSPAKKDK